MGIGFPYFASKLVDGVLEDGDLALLLRLDQDNLLLMFPQHVDLVVQPFLIHLMYRIQELDLIRQCS